MKQRLAILASGGGSNADNIMRHFEHSELAEVVLLACNKPGAGAFDVAAKWHVPSMSIDKSNFKESAIFLKKLQELQVDWVILAGFLWKVPAHLVKAFENRIINIHPALLPKYGGKGMYGHFVHEAVHAAGEKESGITIHFVNEHYDEGATIFQAKANVESTDGPHEIEMKVRSLEIAHFPRVIERVLREK
jgi:phosphoribosylglycinamide formyltransferase-1